MAAYEARGESDEWYTPRYIFDAIGLVYDLDVASPADGPKYTPCNNWLTQEDDGLKSDWQGRVWMNPPFGHQKEKIQWLTKFFAHGNGIALIPDRTSAPWFQMFAPKARAICWVAPKIKFERADGTVGASPGTGTALFAADMVSAHALARSGLGFTTKPFSE